MRWLSWSLIVVLAFCATGVEAQEHAPLKLIITTPMPGFSGDFDHFGLDRKGNRLFLAAEEHKTVEVFDLQTGARIHSIEGFSQPLMMVYIRQSNHLIVTDGGDSAVHLVDCEKYRIIKTIKLGSGVDHGVLNPINHHYYVENRSGSDSSTHLLSIIDTNSFQHVGDVTGLPGSSNEGMTIDRAGKKLYVNLTGTDEVGVVDLDTNKLVARWPLPEAHNAHAIFLDEDDRRVFVATRQPPRFIVLNADSGQVITSLPCVGVNSDMSFDVARKRIYVTGSEAASVFEQHDADHYEHMADVPTAYRAKSSIFVQDMNRLYVAVSGKGKPQAKLELRVYEAQ
jgi:DNA-binding beta-propeller fold protein YncE